MSILANVSLLAVSPPSPLLVPSHHALFSGGKSSSPERVTVSFVDNEEVRARAFTLGNSSSACGSQDCALRAWMDPLFTIVTEILVERVRQHGTVLRFWVGWEERLKSYAMVVVSLQTRRAVLCGILSFNTDCTLNLTTAFVTARGIQERSVFRSHRTVCPK